MAQNVYPMAVESRPYFQILRRCDGTVGYAKGAPCDRSLVVPDPTVPVALCAKCSAFRVAANRAAFALDLTARQEA